MQVKSDKRRFYTVITVCVLVSGVVTGVWLAEWKNNGLQNTVGGPNQHIASVSAAPAEIPIYFVETEEKKLSISFDAAWNCEKTQSILDVLADNQVTATFFLTNIWLKEYPDMAKNIADAGHEIAMHSVSHPHMPELTEAQMQQELDENYQLISETTGYEPELFRFPFGDYDTRSMKVVKENGFYPIQWSIDTLDTKRKEAANLVFSRLAALFYMV